MSRRAIAHIFGLTFAVAAGAGVLIGPLYFVSFDMGDMMGLKAFAAAVLGGINSVPGTILGGIAIGLLENLAGTYISSAYKDLVAFVILLAMLVFRPMAFLRLYSRQGMTQTTIRPVWALGGGTCPLLVLPFVAPDYVLHVANFVLIMTLPVIGLGFITGFTGRVSLAQGALFGVGAHTSAPY